MTESESDKHKIDALDKTDVIYCNNAGGSQVPNNVLEYMINYMIDNHVQLDCVHQIGDLSKDKCNEARNFVDILLNNIHGKIEFGSSTTQLANNLSYVISESLYTEVIMCDALHYSMVTPFEKKAKKLKWWQPQYRYSFNYNDLFNMITNNTTLIIIPHVSNITGVVFDIKYIVHYIRITYPKIKIIVDGVSYLPHDIIDVDSWDVDFYFVSFYKFLGPHISAIYIKDYQEITSLNHYFLDEPKLQLGSFANETLVGLLGIRDYISPKNQITRKNIAEFFDDVKQKEFHIVQRCDWYINQMEIFDLITDRSFSFRRFPIFSLDIENYSVDSVNVYLNETGIMTSCGKFYCNKLLKNDILRISFLHYNTLTEVDKVFHELNQFNASYYRINDGLFYLVGVLFQKNENTLYHQHKFNLSTSIIDKYNELSVDNHYSNTRFRRYSLIDTKNLQILGTKFYQSKIYNKTDVGNKVRKYEPINIINDKNFKTIVSYFISQVKTNTSINIDKCMVHQIRVQINNDEETITPVPEGIHQDGYNFVAIMCINRYNITGGINKLYSLNYNDVIQEYDEILSTILKPGEMIFFNDRKVKHFVSNINRSCKDKKDLAYRDILVLTTVF